MFGIAKQERDGWTGKRGQIAEQTGGKGRLERKEGQAGLKGRRDRQKGQASETDVGTGRQERDCWTGRRTR